MLEEFKDEQVVAYKIMSKIDKYSSFSHAYLIETNGYDKGLKLAIAFAKIILCPSHDQRKNNCANCHQCEMIDDNNFTELKIISPDGSWIKKEQLIDLQEEFNMKPIVGKRKVYILYQADKLNINSSNSILKFLEEPQDGITAILVTDNQYQLIDTILSRCQIISLNGQADFHKYSDTFSKMGQLLTNNEIEFEEFINNEKNKELLDFVVKFSEFSEKNKKKTILYINQYWFSRFNDKIEMNKAIFILLYWYKDILNKKVGHEEEIFTDYDSQIINIANMNTVKQLVKKIECINVCRQNLEYNANLNLLMDKLILQMEGEKYD